MRGRKPKPTQQKILEGNPGRRPLNQAEPRHPVLSSDVPRELATDEEARLEWLRLEPLLKGSRQITQADRAALIACCLEWSRYLHAIQQVADKGPVIASPNGYPIINPWLSIATKALAGCNKLWPELGLTPSSRSRVKEQGPPPGGDAFSEFDTPPPLGPVTEH